MSLTPKELKGHPFWALERFDPKTRHMIQFEVLTSGYIGEMPRLYLSEDGYAKALEAQQQRQIKIKRHARMVEGHIIFDTPRKHRH